MSLLGLSAVFPWLLALASIPIPADEDPGQAESATVGCDATALYLLLELEGQPRELATIQALLAAGDEGRGPVSRLQAAASRLGLAARPLAVRTEREWPDRPLLILLRRGDHLHHVAARPVGHSGKLVQLLDGLQGPRALDKAAILASPEWTGAAMATERPWNRWRMAGASALAVGCGLLTAAGIGSRNRPRFVDRSLREPA